MTMSGALATKWFDRLKSCEEIGLQNRCANNNGFLRNLKYVILVV